MPYLNPPTKDQYQDILKDIGTDEETIKRDVKYLMEWLEQTAYLPSVKDEEFFTAILVRCKNQMEKAKSFLDYYYSRRTLESDMFACRDPCDSELKRSIELFPIFPLPKLTPEGYRILIYSSPKQSNIPKMSYILSAWQMQMEILLKSDISKGLILIGDSINFSISQSTLFLAEFKKILDILKKTSKTRYKDSYMINVTPALNTFFNATKQFLSGKLLGRVQTWTKKPEDLVEVLPKHVLPSEFGGDERSLEELKKAWYDFVMEHRDWFEVKENLKADLTKRPEDDPLSEEFSSFGLSGTFRKITLD
ncbi:hypothetical protein V9T40_001104 [Parthenolecanium corni]|uniref:CRAL-TRIO domain-containing protein n=1 Tax=Parthenolecanium corni TaxID=536013 RepID=A0AAN9TCX5_9HEMI